MTDYGLSVEKDLLTEHTGKDTSVHNFDSDGKAPVQAHGSSAHSDTIGGESQVTFDKDAGHAHTGSDSKTVTWNSISSKPTAVSSFTNDSGYITGYCTYCDYCDYCTYCDCDCVCYCDCACCK